MLKSNKNFYLIFNNFNLIRVKKGTHKNKQAVANFFVIMNFYLIKIIEINKVSLKFRIKLTDY